MNNKKVSVHSHAHKVYSIVFHATYILLLTLISYTALRFKIGRYLTKLSEILIGLFLDHSDMPKSIFQWLRQPPILTHLKTYFTPPCD